MRFQVAGIDAHFTSGVRVDGLPMGDAAAVATANGFQHLVAPDVGICVIWVACDFDGLNRIVGPESAEATANGAIAVCERLGERWDFDFDGAAMAGGGGHEGDLRGLVVFDGWLRRIESTWFVSCLFASIPGLELRFILKLTRMRVAIAE